MLQDVEFLLSRAGDARAIYTILAFKIVEWLFTRIQNRLPPPDELLAIGVEVFGAVSGLFLSLVTIVYVVSKFFLGGAGAYVLLFILFKNRRTIYFVSCVVVSSAATKLKEKVTPFVEGAAARVAWAGLLVYGLLPQGWVRDKIAEVYNAYVQDKHAYFTPPPPPPPPMPHAALNSVVLRVLLLTNGLLTNGPAAN